MKMQKIQTYICIVRNVDIFGESKKVKKMNGNEMTKAEKGASKRASERTKIDVRIAYSQGTITFAATKQLTR